MGQIINKFDVVGRPLTDREWLWVRLIVGTLKNSGDTVQRGNILVTFLGVSPAEGSPHKYSVEVAMAQYRETFQFAGTEEEVKPTDLGTAAVAMAEEPEPAYITIDAVTRVEIDNVVFDRAQIRWLVDMACRMSPGERSMYNGMRITCEQAPLQEDDEGYRGQQYIFQYEGNSWMLTEDHITELEDCI